MITRVDGRLSLEVLRYALRFGCEDCSQFDEERDVCAHGYPTEPHRKKSLAIDSELIFCKEFELC